MEQHLRYLKSSQRPTSSQMQKYLCTCYCLYIIFLSYEHLVEIERISFVPCHQFCLSKYIFYYLITISLMPAHIVLFEVIKRVFVESLYEPENVREVNLSIIFINVTSLPLASISIKILYKNMFLADVDPYIIIETYVVLLISLILKENESALFESMYVLLFNPPDESLLSSYFCSSIFLENTGFFETRER